MRGLHCECNTATTPFWRFTNYPFCGFAARDGGAAGIELFDPELMLHLFQRVALGFRIDEENYKELQNHHRGEEDERRAGGVSGKDGKCAGNNGVHDPVRGTTE